MLARGINIAPSQFEAGFISLAHTGRDIEKTIKAAFNALKEC
jgi:glutamate-1-semialdehyde 2,1-aminomutase